MNVKLVLYILCSLAIIFFLVLLNKLSVAEGVTVGWGDLILRNVGLLYIFTSLRKYLYDK